MCADRPASSSGEGPGVTGTQGLTGASLSAPWTQDTGAGLLSRPSRRPLALCAPGPMHLSTQAQRGALWGQARDAGLPQSGRLARLVPLTGGTPEAKAGKLITWTMHIPGSAQGPGAPRRRRDRPGVSLSLRPFCNSL